MFTSDIPLKEIIRSSTSNILSKLGALVEAEDDDQQATAQTVVCICHHGNDSQTAVERIKDCVRETNKQLLVFDVIGGLDAWSRHIDKNLARY